jgi:hypothetical protein
LLSILYANSLPIAPQPIIAIDFSNTVLLIVNYLSIVF